MKKRLYLCQEVHIDILLTVEKPAKDSVNESYPD
jgi:hypothetical protein